MFPVFRRPTYAALSAALSGVLLCTGPLCAAEPQPNRPAPTTGSARASSPTASDYLGRQDVQDFLRDVSRKRLIPYEWLSAEVSVARYSPLTERYTTPRPNANKVKSPEKNYLLYARNLVNEERVSRGAAFIKEHQADFERTEAQSGVSRYAVAAIIGIESIYGRNMGRFRVLDALMTLSFDYTRRASFYRSELESFLDFCWREQVSPVTILGSFAGAMGMGQFMPSSLDAYAVDGDGDHRIDIINNPADGIASVANFLKMHGWQPGLEPLYPVEATREIFTATASGGIKPNATVAALIKAGVKPLGGMPAAADEPVLLVDIPYVSGREHGVKWFVGTRNFSAVLNYNRSYFYATAVCQLADKIRERCESVKTK